ncbi:C25 family cysteine peptidase [Rhizobium leguminosarum]|uniref:Peptidase C25 family protein n=1 Tax=Rhizobium leguminosarum TaxID=384 RepID=A0A2Z4YVL2_RHILE|nr:C25 family cysteine peptidase [Rhizobium leguminosarum]AXA44618.1 Peptidase C25 family protein [Rhizobium leguminosarum]
MSSERIDKAIISNRSALIAKYAQAGATAIYKMLEQLVAHDKKRGLIARVFDIDDETVMAGVDGRAVVNAADERSAKDAVDAIQYYHDCDYIMLLDGPDIIPHINLDPPSGLADADVAIPSDLPYASPAAFGRQVNKFLTVTRVVGRLPAAHGETSPQKLIDLIENAIAHTSRPLEDFPANFAITANVWKASTQISLVNLFGDHSGLFLCPDDMHPVIDPSLDKRVHFINCHGASGDWRFYGQLADEYPVAMDSEKVSSVPIKRDALVAAECCYGGELYNYLVLACPMPMCMTYLLRGTAAFVGSTTISYGPSDSNGMADLICQFFLEKALTSGSTGRAFLEARQRFIRTQYMSDPTNAKTIAQFNLYGDPSLVPINAEDSADAPIPKSVADILADQNGRPERKARRVALESIGRSVASISSKAGKRVPEAEADKLAAVDHFKSIAIKLGVAEPVKVFQVTGGPEFRRANKGLANNRRIAVTVVAGERNLGDASAPFYKLVIGHIIGDGIFKVCECESR